MPNLHSMTQGWYSRYSSLLIRYGPDKFPVLIMALHFRHEGWK
jgi:hypothetical protein